MFMNLENNDADVGYFQLTVVTKWLKVILSLKIIPTSLE